jgi:hypothetical protein
MGPCSGRALCMCIGDELCYTSESRVCLRAVRWYSGLQSRSRMACRHVHEARYAEKPKLMAGSSPGQALADLAITMLSERAKLHVHEEVSTKLAQAEELLMKEVLNVQCLNKELDSLRTDYERKQDTIDSMTRMCWEHQRRQRAAECEVKQVRNQVKQSKR